MPPEIEPRARGPPSRAWCSPTSSPSPPGGGGVGRGQKNTIYGQAHLFVGAANDERLPEEDPPAKVKVRLKESPPTSDARAAPYSVHDTGNRPHDAEQ